MRLVTYLPEPEGQDVFTKSNSLFNFNLLSCPLLETFDLYIGQVISAFGAINLDFRGQANMKQIKIEQVNCRHYSFHHELGKDWKNIKVPAMHKTWTFDEIKSTPYHINLAWDTNNNKIDIQLNDCKW